LCFALGLTVSYLPEDAYSVASSSTMIDLSKRGSNFEAADMSDENSKPSSDAVSGDGPILVALDFTEDSKAALLWACEYSACTGIPIVAVHVIHDPGETPGYYRQSDDDLLRPLEEIAGNMMADFLDQVRTDHPEAQALKSIETALVKGIPETRILEVAESRGACMIVMGSRGRTGLPHLLLGSKAERVTQLAPIPVTIVKAENHGA
jgi:nucleotide-binding universal stress UspA family protein